MVTDVFPSKGASTMENTSMLWRHHAYKSLESQFPTKWSWTFCIAKSFVGNLPNFSTYEFLCATNVFGQSAEKIIMVSIYVCENSLMASPVIWVCTLK